MATILKTVEWFYTTSKEFQEAYNVLSLDTSGRHDFIGMKHYLLCHALELALKGLLITTGRYTETDLKRQYGHDLIKALNEVEKTRGGCKEINECRSYISMINDDYRNKGYEYPIKNGSFRGIQYDSFSKTVQFFVDTLANDIRSRNFSDGPMP